MKKSVKISKSNSQMYRHVFFWTTVYKSVNEAYGSYTVKKDKE